MVVNFNGKGHWSSPRNPSINRNINSYVIIKVTMNNGINFIQLRNIYFLKIFIVIFICEVMCEGWHFTHIWKHLHDLLISSQREICAHETSLTPPRYIEVHVPSQKSERTCIYVYGYHFWLFKLFFLLEFGAVHTL